MVYKIACHTQHGPHLMPQVSWEEKDQVNSQCLTSTRLYSFLGMYPQQKRGCLAFALDGLRIGRWTPTRVLPYSVAVDRSFSRLLLCCCCCYTQACNYSCLSLSIEEPLSFPVREKGEKRNTRMDKTHHGGALSYGSSGRALLP